MVPPQPVAILLCLLCCVCRRASTAGRPTGHAAAPTQAADDVAHPGSSTVRAARALFCEESRLKADAQATAQLLRYTLQRSATEDGAVIVTTATKGVLHFLDNWFYFAARLGLAKHCLVVSFDNDTTEYVETRWPGQTLPGELWNFGGSAKLVQSRDGPLPIHSPHYNALLKCRPLLLLSILHAGFSPLFSDLDIVLLQNPFPWFQNPRFSVYISLDTWWGAPDTELTPFVSNSTANLPFLCVGFMFLRANTTASVLLMEMWAGAFLFHPDPAQHSDNVYLNNLVQAMLRNATEASPGHTPEGLEGKGREREGKGITGNDSLRGSPGGNEGSEGSEGASLGLPYSIAALPVRCFAPGWSILQWGDEWAMRRHSQCLTMLHFDYMYSGREKQRQMHRLRMWGAAIGTPPHTLQRCHARVDRDGTVVGLNRTQLVQHALPRLRDGTLIVSSLSQGDLDDLSPFLASLNQAQLTPNTLIFVYNQLMFQAVNEQHNGMALLVTPPDNSSSNSSPVACCNDSLVVSRHRELVAVIMKELGLNITVCYSSVKALWFRWPFPLPDDFDFLIRYPGEAKVDPKGSESSWEVEEKNAREATLAWLCVKPSAVTAEFVERWIKGCSVAQDSLVADARLKAFRAALLRRVGARVRALSSTLMPPLSLVALSNETLSVVASRIAVLDTSACHGKEEVDKLVKAVGRGAHKA